MFIRCVHATFIRMLLAALLTLTSGLSSAQDAAINTIIDKHWAWVLSEYPEMRLEYGDRSGNRQWTDVSPKAHEARHKSLQSFIKQLTAIEPSSLSESAQLNRAMLLRDLRDDT